MGFSYNKIKNVIELIVSEERIKALEETVKELEDDRKMFIEGMIFLEKKINKLELLNRSDEK